MTIRPPRTWPMPPARFSLALIALLAVVLRLYDLGSPSLWWDEANTMHYSAWAADPAKLFDTAYINEAPLMPLLALAWNAVIDAVTGLPRSHPAHDFLLRLLPFSFGMGSLFLLHALAKQLTGNSRAALLAAFLFAIAPFQIHYAQELRVYSAHVFCALAAALCMLRALGGGRWPWWLGMALANAALFYGHYISVWIIFCFNTYFLIQWAQNRQHFWKWTAWNALMMALITPGLYHAWKCNQHMLLVEYTWYPTPTLRSLYVSFKNFFSGYSPYAWAYRPLLVVSITLLGLGCWRLKNNTRTLPFIVLLVFGPVLLNFMMWRMRDFSMYEDRLFLFSAALCFIPIGLGLAGLEPRLPRRIMVAAVCALTAPALFAHYTGKLHPVREHRLAICDKVDFRSAARLLESEWQEGDFLAHDSMFTYYPMKYYLSKPQAHLGALPSDREPYVKAFGNTAQLEHLGSLPVPAEETLQGVKRIWYVEAYGVTADDKPQSEKIGDWLSKRCRLRQAHEFDGLRVYLFEPKDGAITKSERPDA